MNDNYLLSFVSNSNVVKLTPKLISSDGRGNSISVSQVQKDEKVREIWLNSGGSVSNAPIRIGVGLHPYNLPEAGRQDLLDESYRLWKYDPLGGNIVRTTTFFTLGRGLIFQFDDESAQFHAKKFYTKNNLEVRLRAASDEGNALGEVYIWLRPKTVDEKKGNKSIWRRGDTQVTFINPQNITNIETAPEDVGDVRNFIFEWADGVNPPAEVTIPHMRYYDLNAGDAANGCIIQIKFNAGNLDPFGHSDLIPVKEWLDNYQEYLRDGVIINKLYRSPAYDISIEDGSADEVSAAIARYRNWSIGSNPVHNSREEWKILEFTGPNASNEQARRALLLMIAAGVGFAEFMLADGANANLASSKSQQLPVIKKFEDRQEIWGHHLMMMFQFALETKAALSQKSGLTLETDEEGDPLPFNGRVEFPSISQDRDLEVAQTNQLAIASKYMSLRTAAARLNLDLDREIEQSRNDIDKLKELKDMLVGAGLIIEGAMLEPENSKSRGGQANDDPKKDRSREPGGSNAPVKT